MSRREFQLRPLPDGGTNWERGSDTADKRLLHRDAVFDALADRKRRCVLYAVTEQELWDLDELAREVAALNAGSQPDRLDDELIETVAESLYHVHLPQLAEADAVSFDSNQRQVESGPMARPLRSAVGIVGSAIEDEQRG